MSQEKDVIDTVTPKIIIAMLFKSRNTMNIVSLKTTSSTIKDITSKYYSKLLPLINTLAELNFEVAGKRETDRIPPSEYIDPIQHMNDCLYYFPRYIKLFKTPEEQNIYNKILSLMNKTKNSL